MWIKYKFRSSLYSETLNIHGRNSISAGELRCKILRALNLGSSRQKPQDFDLVLYDEVSGQEYKVNDFKIPSGSSVIVKRIPARHDESLDIFDFGADPLLDTNLPEIVLEFGENNFKSSENEVTSGLRPLIETVEDFGMKDFCPLGPADESMDEFDVSADWRSLHDINFPNFGLEFHCAKEDIAGLRPSMGNFKPAQITKMPVELICSLCNTCIKEAVMIPCCQYSFCEKCIRWVLIEKERCPKCSSSECKVEDLLPNLTLRGVIEHFIKSQMLDTGLENAMQKYAPADSKNKETEGSWIGTQGTFKYCLTGFMLTG
ncbi:E3 ubiquitin ligase PARAQUAT TOLERANCE 3-like [Forsythia ovata]|uniref:E3 ubiquitin ligase PARAQUAT TOLERANCE 3-like n=1 Tax=Forsythia ovata TaxID=205694 RepID=A0ABD1W8L5_9LAMI